MACWQLADYPIADVAEQSKPTRKADSSLPKHHHRDLLADRRHAESGSQLAEWGGTPKRRSLQEST